MMKVLNLKQWNWIRVIRLVLTLIVGYEAIRSGEVVFYIIAGVLLIQTVFGGTCGVNNSCVVNNESDKQSLENVEYEEIK
jgi:uncharacterized membrane protein HdeD (DUF308 family)